MDRIGQWLWYANLAATGALLVRFGVTGLWRIYRVLFSYFVAMTAGSLLLLQISFRSNSYALVYMINETILHTLVFFTVLELYRLALAKHAGLASFGRAAVWAVTVVVAFVAFVSALLDRAIPRGQSVILHRYFTVERTLEMVIVLFLLSIALFITWFPVQMPRNAALSIAGFSAFYTARAGGLLAANLLPRAHLGEVNDAMLAASAILLLAWTSALRPEAVSAEVVTGHTWDPEALGELSHQLDSINAALGRFGRS
jgi:hypothetical protein